MYSSPRIARRTHLTRCRAVVLAAAALADGGAFGQAIALPEPLVSALEDGQLTSVEELRLLQDQVRRVVAAMRPVTVPADPVSTAAEESFGRSVLTGVRYAWDTEPIRSLVLLSMVLGSSFSVMQIAMPRVVEQDFELEAGSASTILATFGLGMFLSSAVMATRPIGRHGWNIALCVGFGLGAGQFALSFAPGFASAVVIMFLWGINAGIAMTSHRTVLQRSTAPEMMGRVMGLMMTGFMGGLPLGALVSSLLSAAVSPATTMTIVGASTIVIAGALSWRPTILRLT